MNKVATPAKHEPASPKAPNALFGLIAAAHALESRLETSMADVGLSLAKYGVLKTLAAAREPLTLTELASHQQCVRSNITQLIDRLEADGFVKRVDDPADRRSIRATLTPLGREKAAAGERQMSAMLREVSSAVSPDDRAALGRVFEALR